MTKLAKSLSLKAAAFFTLYKSTRLCDLEDCSFCTTIKEQAKGPLLREYLLSARGQRGEFHIDKPSSDQSTALHSFATEKFGTPVLQCGQHSTGDFPNFRNSTFALGTF